LKKRRRIKTAREKIKRKERKRIVFVNSKKKRSSLEDSNRRLIRELSRKLWKCK